MHVQPADLLAHWHRGIGCNKHETRDSENLLVHGCSSCRLSGLPASAKHFISSPLLLLFLPWWSTRLIGCENRHHLPTYFLFCLLLLFLLPHGFTFTWLGCCGLCLWHEPTELAHSFSFCSCVCFCLCGPFNCISFPKFSRQLSVLSLCSSGLISALLVLSAIYLFLKVSFSPDIISSGWLGWKHQLTN